jgi:hypothetical protein
MDGGLGLAESDVEIAGVIGDGHSFADGGHKDLTRRARISLKRRKHTDFIVSVTFPVHTHSKIYWTVDGISKDIV